VAGGQGLAGFGDFSAVQTAGPPAPLLFVHGGPGTGKSYVVRRMYDTLRVRFGPDVIQFMAPSGIAACNLPRGRTLHNRGQVSCV
jgi:hypothetical protein